MANKEKSGGNRYATNSMATVKAPRTVNPSGEPKASSYKTTVDLRTKKTGK